MKCVAKESMNNRQICVKINWYCTDTNAQNLLDMTSHVCSDSQWTTKVRIL